MPAFRRPTLNASKLTVHRPESDSRRRPPATLPVMDVAYWRVNGYRAAMLVWTDAEFERLAAYERPPDAQHLSCGVWAVLRMV